MEIRLPGSINLGQKLRGRVCFWNIPIIRADKWIVHNLQINEKSYPHRGGSHHVVCPALLQTL